MGKYYRAVRAEAGAGMQVGIFRVRRQGVWGPGIHLWLIYEPYIERGLRFLLRHSRAGREAVNRPDMHQSGAHVSGRCALCCALI